MTVPSLPTGYDETRHVQAGRSDCHITVGFDRGRTHIPRFLIQLHYQVETAPVRWNAIARMDHNETSTHGHDVYREGLHIDLARRSKPTVHLSIRHGPLSASRGTVIRGCAEYLQQNADYCIDVYERDRSPGGPPRYSPDGGGRPPTLMPADSLRAGMSQESPVENALTLEELSEDLAEAEGTTAEAIERGAEELEIAPLSEADVVDE